MCNYRCDFAKLIRYMVLILMLNWGLACYSQKIIYECTPELAKALIKIKPKVQSGEPYIDWFFSPDNDGADKKDLISVFSWRDKDSFPSCKDAPEKVSNRYLNINGTLYRLILPDEDVYYCSPSMFYRNGNKKSGVLFFDGGSVSFNHTTGEIQISPL